MNASTSTIGLLGLFALAASGCSTIMGYEDGYLIGGKKGKGGETSWASAAGNSNAGAGYGGSNNTRQSSADATNNGGTTSAQTAANVGGAAPVGSAGASTTARQAKNVTTGMQRAATDAARVADTSSTAGSVRTLPHKGNHAPDCAGIAVLTALWTNGHLMVR